MPTQLAAPARLYCLKSSEGTESVAFTDAIWDNVGQDGACLRQ
jgi:hypothetical protein